ncbi:MAG: glycoside hydrolase family 2 TIM barrel-domain containing protein, partial [Firmicutes bacterium]|nr:glycoside hydrolase family 2 TIM barrel-domain containing protein [Bacillota bacterium]
SHNPASRALLDACNEQGIMVMNEAFDCWWSSKNVYDFHRFFDTPCTHPDAEEGQTWQEYDIKNMVKGSRNDPAIVMWSIGN